MNTIITILLTLFIPPGPSEPVNSCCSYVTAPDGSVSYVCYSTDSLWCPDGWIWHEPREKPEGSPW